MDTLLLLAVGLGVLLHRYALVDFAADRFGLREFGLSHDEASRAG
jgi:hypothetical protein